MIRLCEDLSDLAGGPKCEVGENCWDLWFALTGSGAGGVDRFRDSKNLGMLGIVDGDNLGESSSVSARRFPKGLILFPGNLVFVL